MNRRTLEKVGVAMLIIFVMLFFWSRAMQVQSATRQICIDNGYADNFFAHAYYTICVDQNGNHVRIDESLWRE